MAKEKIKKDPFYMDTNTEKGAKSFDDYIYQQLAKIAKTHPEVKAEIQAEVKSEDKKGEKYPSLDYDLIDEILNFEDEE